MPDVAPQPTHSTKRAALAAILILVVGLILRLYSISGDVYPDSAAYAQNAYDLAHGSYSLRDDSWIAQRLPVFVPVAGAYALFGVGAASTNLWPLLASLAQLALVMWLGVRLLGRAAGLISAAVLAVLPLDVVQAGALLPDGVLAALLTAAAALWLAAPGARRGGRLLCLLSGASLALAADTRLYALLLGILYAGDLLLRRRRVADLAWAVVGAIVVAAPLGALYATSTGDPLYALRVVTASYGSVLKPEPAALQFYPSHLWHPESALGLHALLFAAAGGYALARPTRPRVLLFLWVLPLLLYLEFGSMSLSAYAPVFKRTRFLTIAAAPLSLLVGSVAAEIVSALARRRGRVALAAAALVALAVTADALTVVHADRHQRRRAYDESERAVALLRRSPLPIVVDHWRTALRLSYFLDFHRGAHVYHGGDDRARMRRPAAPRRAPLGYLAWYPAADSLPPSFVILDDEVLAAVRVAPADPSGPYRAGEIPAYAYRPPSGWRLAGRAGTWRVYVVGPTASTTRGGSSGAAPAPADTAGKPVVRRRS